MSKFQSFFAYESLDSKEIRLEKFATFLVAGCTSIAGLIWSIVYNYFFDWGITSVLPLAFTFIVGTSLIVSHVTRNHRYAIYAQIICVIYITFGIQWSIGTLADSGYVVFWGILGPITALMFFSYWNSAIWLVLYLINIVITIIFYDYFVDYGQSVSHTTELMFFAMNLGTCSVVVFIFAGYYVQSSIRERARAHQLLDANLKQEILLRQSEKLATLGRMSAGMSHELNNPAAATESGVIQLKESVAEMGDATLKMGKFKLTPKQEEALRFHMNRIRERAREPVELDALNRSDLEEELQEWLELKGSSDTWKIVSHIVGAGYTVEELRSVEETFPEEMFPAIINTLAHTYNAYSVLSEIGLGADRIIEIVKAMKSYSYQDQAAIQSIFVHEGLDSTLVMMRSRLRTGINVIREYDKNLPQIEAHGPQLNQVWTNVIDNAISAMGQQGTLLLKTYREGNWVVVEIHDSGPGILEEIQGRVFDPFFTTKAPGEGTGLGLNISHNIVVDEHKGEISVTSGSGETCFKIKLPIKNLNGD